MKVVISHKSSILTKALIPSFIGVVFLTLERAVLKGFLHPQGLKIGLPSHDDDSTLENSPKWFLESVYHAAKGLEETIFEAYASYPTFMLMMLIVNAFLHGPGFIRYLSTKRNKQGHVYPDIQGSIKTILQSLLGYSLVFCFYQWIWIYAGSSILALNKVSMVPNRILEEGETLPLSLSSSQRPSLSIGKILSQVDIYAVSIKLSNDEKTAFVATKFPSTIKIIDISDSEYPVVLSSLILPARAFDFVFKSLIISPDETKLYLSDIESLQIFDISNFKSPFAVATVPDRAALIPAQDEKIYGIIKPNLLLSRDNKYLFVSGYGLQIFDISLPTAPTLIRSLRSRVNSGVLAPASIALSADKKTLYYSDSGLSIYDVEDPKNMKILNSFDTTYPISSMIISDDFNTAFVIGLDQKSKIFLQSLDISEVNSIKEGSITKFNQSATCQPIFLERTPKNLFLMIVFMDEIAGIWQDLFLYDTKEQRLISHPKLLMKDSLSVLFTQDYKKVLMGNAARFEIADLYPEHPNKHAFTASSNIIRTFDSTGLRFFSSNGEDLFYGVLKNKFGVYRSNPKSEQLRNLSVHESEEEIKNLVVSKDCKRAFLIYQDHVKVVDISNPENIIILEDYILKVEKGLPLISSLALSQDGKTGYLTFACFGMNYLEVLDLYDLNKTLRVELGSLALYMTPLLSKDERTLFLMSKNLMVWNVSDAWHPTLLTTFSCLDEEGNYKTPYPTIKAVLSPDGNTLLIKDESSLSDEVIRIIDVSDINFPQVRSEFRFSLAIWSPVYAEKSVLFSADSKIAYISRSSSLMVVDTANPSSPKYLGSIRVLNDTNDIVEDFSLNKDGRKAQILTKEGKLHIVGIDPIYSTYLRQDTVLLGERYNIDLLVLEMNEYMDYNRMGAEYRFTRFSLVESRSIQNIGFEDVILKMAPSWMSFDLKGQVLTVEARRKNDIGTYRAYFGFSTQLPKNLFSTGPINESLAKTDGPIKPQDVFATLIALAYVDNQLFLTENFGDYDDFILPSQYEPIRKEIYETLKRYSFGTYNELKIVESLNVVAGADDNKLKISTTSGANLKVEIRLTEEAQFLHKYYGALQPLITQNKSRLVLEGSLKDVNLALREVVVNLGNGKPCDGEMIVDDRLNPVRIEFVKNISRYFNKNMPPALNNKSDFTIQDQVDKEIVSTGQYFQIKLNPYTFFDFYTEVDNLIYQLALVKNHNETTVLPTWLSFSDLTLMGTAPEEIFDRNFEFRLIVKNEFQELKVPLKLHVSISSGYVLKLVMKYSPYILSIVGLLISANKIFNVVFKKTYRHPKDFCVRIGQEITPEVIFPVGFIREEIREARRILDVLEKKFGKKRQLLSSFMSQERKRLDKFKVIETIKEILKKLSPEEKKLFVLYLGGSHPERIISQIIINILTNEMLKLNEERETQVHFERIKKNWPELVDWDLVNSCFKINDEKLNSFLNRSENESILTNDDGESLLLSSSFIEKSKTNIDLLKDSILAYAFECQNIDILPVSVEFHVKEKIKTNFLKQFLKLDLRDCPFRERGKIGYGIEYFKEYQTLYFQGIVRPDMRNKTLVVQITNLQHKILKEIWIIGDSENEGIVANDRKEFEAQGKGYEVF